MSYENHYQQGSKKNGVYSKRLKAGKRRTYFFDVRTTKANDYFLTITESKKRFDDNGYERHKIFLYKEDFNKFIDALGEAVDYVKTELLPDFDFDQFSHDDQISEAAVIDGAPGDVSAETREAPAETAMAEAAEAAPSAPSEESYSEVESVSAELPSESTPSINEQVEKW